MRRPSGLIKSGEAHAPFDNITLIKLENVSLEQISIIDLKFTNKMIRFVGNALRCQITISTRKLRPIKLFLTFGLLFF